MYSTSSGMSSSADACRMSGGFIVMWCFVALLALVIVRWIVQRLYLTWADHMDMARLQCMSTIQALLKARCDESEDSEDLVAQLRSALEQWHPPQMCTAPTKLLQFQLNQAQRVVTAGQLVLESYEASDSIDIILENSFGDERQMRLKRSVPMLVLKNVIHTGHAWWPGRPEHELLLSFGGTPLDDAQTLDDIGAEDGAVIRINDIPEAERLPAVPEYEFIPADMTFAEHEVQSDMTGRCVASVASEAQNAQLVAMCHGRVFWVGAKRINDDNGPGADHWQWSDATPWEYTNWAQGEPNNAGGREHHVQVYSNGQWNDIHADWKGPAVYSCAKVLSLREMIQSSTLEVVIRHTDKQVSTDDVPGYSVLGQNSSARNDIEEMVDTEVQLQTLHEADPKLVPNVPVPYVQ